MTEAAQAREASVGFEAKKDRLSQTQDGLWKVTFTVKPEDMQTAILNASMGTRYMLAAVEIGDNEEAVPPNVSPKEMAKSLSDGERAKRHFEAMCQDEELSNWITEKWGRLEKPPMSFSPSTRNVTKWFMGIQSANELLDNPDLWHALYNEYQYRNSMK